MDYALEQAGFDVAWQAEIDPDAADVLGHHWPEVMNYGDVTQIDTNQLSPVDLVAGGSPCFVAGTLILTDRGLIPIEQVQVGDLALTHKNRWQPVKAVMQRRAPTLFVKGQGHPGIRTTVDHPFWARIKESHYHRKQRESEIRWLDPGWVPAKDLLGQRWASPAEIPVLPIPPIVRQGREAICPAFSSDFFWFVGAWLGDGWVNLHQRPHRSPGQTRGQVFIGVGFDDADALAQRLTQAGLRFYRSRERTTARFCISHRPLARWLNEQFGQYSFGKHLPTWVYGMPREWRQALWDGYCWTDGHRQANGVQVSSVSRALIFGMKLLVQSLGMTGYVHDATPHREAAVIEGRTVAERPILALRIYDAPKSGYHDDGMVWQLVRKVHLTGEIEDVYNLEVAEDHSYTADGLVVHNCQSFSTSGHREGLAGESGLFWQFLRIADSQPRAWVLWENVPGVLSIDAGETFALILWGFTGFYPQVPPGGWRNSGFCAGPKRAVSWRVLDAQYFGVPQRRRRVFIVGHSVGRGDCAEILFEPDSLPGNSAAGIQAGQVTPTVLASGAGTAHTGGISASDFLVTEEDPEAWSLQLDHTKASGRRISTVAYPLDTGVNQALAVPQTAATLTVGGQTAGRRREDDVNLIVMAADDEGADRIVHVTERSEAEKSRARAFTQNQRDEVRWVGGDGRQAGTLGAHVGAKQQTYVLSNAFLNVGYDQAPTLQAQSSDHDCLVMPYTVRRLMPVEAERLMGVPDDWTRWGTSGRKLADAARYRICGNGVAVPVVIWIAQRIARAMAGEAVNR